MKRILASVLLTTLAALVFAAGPLCYSTEHFEIIFDESEESFARILLGRCEDEYQKYAAMLGLEGSSTITVFLEGRPESSFIDPDPRASITLVTKAAGDYLADFSRLLAKFMVLGYEKGSLLGDAYTKAAFNMPSWIADGISYYLSGQSLDISSLGFMPERDRLASLADEAVASLYGYGFVQYLAQTYGEPALHAYIQGCRKGPLSSAKAFTAAFGLNIDDAFNAFDEGLRTEPSLKGEKVQGVQSLDEMLWLDSELYGLGEEMVLFAGSTLKTLSSSSHDLSISPDGLRFSLVQTDGSHSLYCLYSRDGKLLLKSSAIDRAVLLDAIIAAFRLEGDMLALDAYDYSGNLISSHVIGPMGSGFYAAAAGSELAVKAGDFIYLLNADLQVRAAYQAALDQFSYCDGRLYGVSGSRLAYLDLETGSLSIASQSVGPLSYPSIHNGMVYYLSERVVTKIALDSFTFTAQQPRAVQPVKPAMLKSQSAMSVEVGQETAVFSLGDGLFTITLPGSITPDSMEAALAGFASRNPDLMALLGTTAMSREPGKLVVSYDQELTDQAGEMIIAILVQDLKTSYPGMAFANLKSIEGQAEAEPEVVVETAAAAEEALPEATVKVEPDSGDQFPYSEFRKGSMPTLVPFYRDKEKMLLGLGISYLDKLEKLGAGLYAGYALQDLRPVAFANVFYEEDGLFAELSDSYEMGLSNVLGASVSWQGNDLAWYRTQAAFMAEVKAAYTMGFDGTSLLAPLNRQTIDISARMGLAIDSFFIGPAAKVVWLVDIGKSLAMGGLGLDMAFENSSSGVIYALPLSLEAQALMGSALGGATGDAMLITADLDALVIGFSPVEKSDSIGPFIIDRAGLYGGISFEASSQGTEDDIRLNRTGTHIGLEYYGAVRLDASYMRFEPGKPMTLELKASWNGTLSFKATLKARF